MAIYSGFFNSIDHDRMYNASHFSRFFDGLISDGVYINYPEKDDNGNIIPDNGKAFYVSAASGRTVNVAPGRCWFNRAWMYSDAVLPISLDRTLVDTLSRIDAIVIDVNTADHDIDAGVENGRMITIKVVKGSEAKTPERPVLVNETNHHQYPIAYVKVVSQTVSQENIVRTIAPAVLDPDSIPAVEALVEYSSRSKAELKAYVDASDTVLQNQIDNIVTPTFQEAVSVANIAGSGENINTMWGKVKKIISTIINVLPVQYGGTGKSSHTTNSVLVGNNTSAVKNIPSANGALYSTGANGAPQFGILPIAQGGTGATTKEQALNNLGVPANVQDMMSKSVYTNSSDAVLVSHGGTGKTSVTSGYVLVGNGTSAMTERQISTSIPSSTSSNVLVTGGAIKSAINTLQSNFQAGVDTIYNAVFNRGITPSASTPTALADAIKQKLSNYYLSSWSEEIVLTGTSVVSRTWVRNFIGTSYGTWWPYRINIITSEGIYSTGTTISAVVKFTFSSTPSTFNYSPDGPPVGGKLTWKIPGSQFPNYTSIESITINFNTSGIGGASRENITFEETDYFLNTDPESGGSVSGHM